MHRALAHVESWIFDLDNCLYPASIGIFARIDARMTDFIQRLLKIDAIAARSVQKRHFHTHGTTLAGLMQDHAVDPHLFLADVHDIALDGLEPDPRVVAGLARLPGRKFVYTNGDAPYAERVLGALGLTGQFAALHDIHAADLRPKPDGHGYAKLVATHDIDPTRAVMVEDMVQNLRPAKALGMTTVWVDNGSERGNHGHDPSFVDFHIADVGAWLDSLFDDGEPA